MASSGNKITKLELRLVDGLSGPAKAAMRSIGKLNKSLGGVRGGGAAIGIGRASLGGIGGTARGTRAAIDAGGRIGSYVDHTRRRAGEAIAVAAAAGAGLAAMGRSSYQGEVELNKAVAAGNLTMKERARAEANAVALNRKYTISVNDILAAHTELLRSGLSFDDSLTALPSTLNLAQATGEATTDTTRAIVTNLTAMRKEMKESARAADLFSAALDATAGVNLQDFATSGKYANPISALTGQTLEQAMAFQIEFAKRGIYGSSAGTGLRAGPAAILSPSKNARAAFAAIGIDPSRYIGQKTGAASAEQIAATLETRGLEVDDEMEAQLAAIIKSQKSDATRSKAIIAAFGEQMGIVTGEDRAEAMQALMQAFNIGSSKVDLPKLLADAAKRGAGVPFYNDVFGKNHGSKWAGFDPSVYGNMLKMLETTAAGSADRKSAIMIQGIVGDVNNLEGSVQGLINTVKNAGVMTDAARAMNAMATAVDRVGKANPELLRFGAAATAAAVAAVPLGLAISGASAALALAVNPLALGTAGLVAFAAVNIDKIADGLDVLRKSTVAALDPAILRRMTGLGTSARRMFASFKIGDDKADAIGQFARNLGRGLAAGANAIGAALPNIEAAGRALVTMATAKWDAAAPKLRAYGEAMRQFAADNAAANLPAIQAGMESIRQAVAGFASTKIDAIVGLGSSLAAFGERVLPMFGAAASSAVKLAAESFRTMAAGVNALGSISNGALDGIVAFAKGFVDNLDPAAMQSVANGVKAALDAMATPARLASEAFDWISRSISGANTSITEFASSAGAKAAQGISAVISALASPKETLTAAWEAIKAVFQAIGSYVPDFSGLIGGITGAVDRIVAIFDRVRSAVETARAAIGGLGSIGGAIGGLPSGGGVRADSPASRAGAAIGAMATPLPRRAAGGLVRAGRSYLVGERGPEVLRMGSQGGNVVPNHKLGSGGNTYHVTINAPTREGNAIGTAFINRLHRSSQTGIDGRGDFG